MNIKETWKKIQIKELLKKLLVKLAVYLINQAIGKIDPPASLKAKGVLSDKQWVFLKNFAKLIQYVETLPGYSLSGGELWRTPEQQAIYLKTGKSQTSNSKHLDRLAIDLNVKVNGVYMQSKEAYKPLADYWVSLHPDNRAGYFFKGGWDANHFEMK